MEHTKIIQINDLRAFCEADENWQQFVGEMSFLMGQVDAEEIPLTEVTKLLKDRGIEYNFSLNGLCQLHVNFAAWLRAAYTHH